MPISPTWEDTVEDSPSWDDTVEEKAVVPEQGLSIPPSLTDDQMVRMSQDLAKRQEYETNLRNYTGGNMFTPGGPDMDFARALYQEVPAKIGEGLHAIMKPIEAVASPVFNALRQATGGTTYAMTGELPVDTAPGETVFRGLEPPAEARGVIPSVRRAAAGMTTPGGMALLPIAGGGGALAKGVQGAFALGAGAAIPGGVQAFIEADTPAEKRGAATDVALSALFAGTMGREAVRPRTSRATTPRPQKPQVAPLAKVEVASEVSSPKAAEALAPEKLPTTASEILENPHGSTAPEAIEALPDVEFNKLIDSKGKKYSLTVDATAWAMGQKPTPELIARISKLRDAEITANQEALAKQNWDRRDRSQWYSDALHALEGDEVGLGNIAKVSQMAKDGVVKIYEPPKEAPIEKATTKEEVETGFTPDELQSAISGDPMGFGKPSFMVPKEPPRVPPPREPGGTTEFPTEGENVKMRKSAERATTSEMIPEPVQERIKTAEESFYKQQSTPKVEDVVKSMTDDQLAEVPMTSNIFVAAKLERADRFFQKGMMDEGYNVFVELEKGGTTFGQNVNQFKLLKGSRPEHVAFVINKKLEQAGKDPLPKAQEKVVIETAKKSKEADTQLDIATEEWAKNPTLENAAKAEKSLLDANEAGMELQRFVSKYQPRSTPAILKSILQGNLLTPISQARNIVGNMAFSPLRAATRTVATGFDVLNNYLTKSPRTITVQPIRGTAEVVKGFGRGAKQIPEIFLRGTGDTIKGETRAGLHPIKAWINQFAKNPEMPTTGGKITLQDRLNLAIEGTFGVPAEAMLRGLGAGDAPFREAARARATATELSLAKVPKDQWGVAQKFPELFLSGEAMARMQSETLRAVFQQPSKTLNLVTNWIRGKGDWFDLAVATVAPYKLTPWNIIGEILSYNPLIAVARSVHSSKIKNPREARLNAGKFVVGSMLTAAGWWLYKSGLMSPSLDQRDESQKARVLSGEVMPPNHINLSGLKRAMSGGDPAFKAGDETADVFSAGGLAGSMFYMTANIGRDFERKPEVADSEIWGAILRQSTLEQARFGMNQSFLSGVEGLLSAVREGNTDNYIRQWGNTVASIPLPNSLTVMSRASREYKPDFREDTFRKQMENIVRNKLGVANMDDYLPLKRGLWGEPMRETPEGRNAIMYHFFDVFKNKQVTSDPVPLELFRLWRKTADTRVIPSLPEKTITMGGNTYAMDAAQQSRYAELVGQSRRTIVDAIVVNPNFHKLPDESKVEILDRVYRAGLQRGKAEFWREIGGGLKLKPSRAGFAPPE